MYFDTHVHFDGIGDMDEASRAVERARDAGVTGMVAVGGTEAGNKLAAAMAEKYVGFVFAAFGYDRDQAELFSGVDDGMEHAVTSLREAVASCTCRGNGPVAVGETGLDFHYLPKTSNEQIRLMNVQLALASELRLPVIVHSREADEQTLKLLDAHAGSWRGEQDRIGVLHCFTGNAVFVRQVLDLGYHVSFSGILSFKNADELRKVAQIVPEDRLLVETDSPYLAPVPYRGQRNEPARIVQVVESLAAARGVDPEHISTITERNARSLFGLTM